MEFTFCGLQFSERNGMLCAGAFDGPDCCVPVSDVRIAGGDILSPSPAKQPFAADALRLEEVRREDGRLIIVQRNALCRVKTHLEAFGDALRVCASVENLSAQDIVLENVSIFNVSGLAAARMEHTYLYRFYNSHHCECQPRRLSFDDLGMFATENRTFRRIGGYNAGSWSTKEELPQAIIEDAEHEKFLFFQIESCGGWDWEVAEGWAKALYLSLSGGTFARGGWKKRLAPGERYATRFAALCLGTSLNGVVQEMTRYRRHTAVIGGAAAVPSVLFNEYMYLSWDTPAEERTRALVPVAAECGAEVYVLDCGWHDDVDEVKIYPYVGRWRESRLRFPHGVRAMTDYIRSFGMKAGLWIEPEVVGTRSGEEYPEDAYIHTNGQRVLVAGRYFLDFRHKEVRRRMGETIARMVEEYGAQYIKVDCNQDCGRGTEVASDSCGDGLEQTSQAFWDWMNEQRAKYPSVLFESCSSGGMRMDWQSLRTSPVISVSDQVRYRKFPYIIGNIFSAVLPEQAAFWSYPVIDGKYEPKDGRPTDDEVAVNMVNGIMGRMHLASDLRKLTPLQCGLVRQGVTLAKEMSEFRQHVLPYLPFGFAKFGDERAAVGLMDEKEMLLGVWGLGKKQFDVPLPRPAESCTAIYPAAADVSVCTEGKTLHVCFGTYSAAVFRIVFGASDTSTRGTV